MLPPFIPKQVLIKIIKPYTRIKISFISGELNIDPADVESLLVSCILDSTIYGRIDQVCSTPIFNIAFSKIIVQVRRSETLCWQR